MGKRKKTKMTTEPIETNRLAKVDREFRAALAKLTGGLAPQDYGAAWAEWCVGLVKSPAKQMALGKGAFDKALDLWMFTTQAMQGKPPPIEAGSKDRRFAHEAWQSFPFNVYARAYQHGSSLLQESVTGVEGVSERNAQLMSFAMQQLSDVLSPTNNPVANPEVIRQTIDEKGANLARGWKNFLDDLGRTLKGGDVPGTENFRVGEHIAVTPGKVVLRNGLMELIQYSPTTATVHAEPVLIVPAWIMKYYILDLSARNSMVKWLVDSGHTVFMISWKNPTAEDRDLGMDDYVRDGFLAALKAVRAIVPRRKVHAVGYCIGGTLLSIGAALLGRSRRRSLASVTLLAAQTDFSEPGELSLFISPAQLGMLEALMHKEGVLDSSKMGSAFTLLRAHDLLWQPAVKNYLKGQRDEMIDLMAWNADGTRMPARMHTEYLYGLYLNNDLAHGRFKVNGKPVSLTDIAVPTFVVGTETDHVAPWKSVYKAGGLVGSADYTFLLTSGGHNAGIVSGPVHPKRQHRIRTRKAGEPQLSADDWVAATEKTAGSWWPAWGAWLQAHSAARRVRPPRMGAAKAGYAPLGDAPGDYVRQR